MARQHAIGNASVRRSASWSCPRETKPFFDETAERDSQAVGGRDDAFNDEESEIEFWPSTDDESDDTWEDIMQAHKFHATVAAKPVQQQQWQQQHHHQTQPFNQQHMGMMSGAGMECCSRSKRQQEQVRTLSLEVGLSHHWPSDATASSKQPVTLCTAARPDNQLPSLLGRRKLFSSTAPKSKSTLGRHLVADTAASKGTTVGESTTLMLRNLPRDLLQRELLYALNQSGFRDLFDFLYLPRCFNSGSNFSYAFINFISPKVAESLMSAWHGQTPFGAGAAPLSIKLADVQGLHQNLSRWCTPRGRRIFDPELRPYVPEKITSDLLRASASIGSKKCR